jgi:hypothetical protein
MMEVPVDPSVVQSARQIDEWDVVLLRKRAGGTQVMGAASWEVLVDVLSPLARIGQVDEDDASCLCGQLAQRVAGAAQMTLAFLLIGGRVPRVDIRSLDGGPMSSIGALLLFLCGRNEVRPGVFRYGSGSLRI